MKVLVGGIVTPLLFVVLASCQGPRTAPENPGASLDPEDFPIRYSIGTFDTRFGISEEEFLSAVAEAKAVWEQGAGRSLFRPESGAGFTLNLVFDERQERTIEARKAKASIDSRGRSYDALVWQHDRRLERMKESQARYDAAAMALQKRLDAHNAEVTSWNERGGAPPEVAARLDASLSSLREGEGDLERLRRDLNDDVEAVNDLVAQVNQLAEENNIQVNLFNGKFVESREFEQGVYDGKGITIYQFGSAAELRLALIHEFGHALGFDHVEEPTAIMHYKIGAQNIEKPALAPADLELLRKRFPPDA